MCADRAPPASPRCRRLLSVIIPAYNAEDTLGEQLDALAAQDYDGEWELVVVDNGSTDDTTRVVEDYKRLLPNLTLVSAPEKQNASYARNRGVESARGAAFIFCDADDVVAPGWISALAEALPRHDVVAGENERQTLNPHSAFPTASMRSGGKTLFHFLPFVASSNMAVSREAFEAVGGFSEEIQRTEDVDLSWRLQLQGYDIHHAPRAVVHCRTRKTLRALWTECATSGESHVLLYRRFADAGMPRPSKREVLRRYRRLIMTMTRLLTTRGRLRRQWIVETAMSWGRLKGSLRYRTLFL